MKTSGSRYSRRSNVSSDKDLLTRAKTCILALALKRIMKDLTSCFCPWLKVEMQKRQDMSD